MEKSVIIIGAGIAGLSAGCYGQMNGYRTSIFEMHDNPGGLCTSWQRRGYTIDGCLHWLVGSREGSSMHRVWEELGALQGRQIVDHDVFVQVEGDQGRVFNLYTDLNRLEQHLRKLAPEDTKMVQALVKAARRCLRFDMPVDKAPELYGLLDKLRLLLKFLPHFMFMRKWSRTTVQDYAARFEDPFVRESLLAVMPTSFPMLALLFTLAWMDRKDAGYAIGGSLEFARAIERRYLALGGDIHYKSRVDKILVADNRATGVRLADGTEHRGDVIVSAADGHATIYDMLDGRYVNKKVNRYYDELPIFPPLVYVGLGVARTFEDITPSVSGISFPLEKPIVIDQRERNRMEVHIYNFDPTLAPEGKTVLTVLFESDYDYWKELKENPSRYREEKQRIASEVVARLDQRFPGLAADVELRDVATPMTFERYTGNWRGSYEGWLITSRTLGMRMSKTLPGLKDFYMVGQWVQPGGGLPPAATSGREVVQIMCKKDGRRFVTSIPHT